MHRHGPSFVITEVPSEIKLSYPSAIDEGIDMCIICYMHQHVLTCDACMTALAPPNSALVYVLMPTDHQCMRANANCCNEIIRASHTSRPVLHASFHA